jgi:hypothetical protein
MEPLRTQGAKTKPESRFLRCHLLSQPARRSGGSDGIRAAPAPRSGAGAPYPTLALP